MSQNEPSVLQEAPSQTMTQIEGVIQAQGSVAAIVAFLLERAGIAKIAEFQEMVERAANLAPEGSPGKPILENMAKSFKVGMELQSDPPRLQVILGGHREADQPEVM